MQQLHSMLVTFFAFPLGRGRRSHARFGLILDFSHLHELEQLLTILSGHFVRFLRPGRL
jgi:hypothetical protein